MQGARSLKLLAADRQWVVELVVCTGRIVSVVNRHAGHQAGSDLSAVLLEVTK